MELNWLPRRLIILIAKFYKEGTNENAKGWNGGFSRFACTSSFKYCESQY